MVGGFTLGCRVVCSILAVSPALYFGFVREGGDAYEFLALVLVAPIAGIVLILNSIFCFIRYHDEESPLASLAYIVIGAASFAEAWWFLPQFRM